MTARFWIGVDIAVAIAMILAAIGWLAGYPEFEYIIWFGGGLLAGRCGGRS